jgi:hypothetical protein
MTTAPFRRIVTGHNEAGEAVIIEDGPPPRVAQIGGAIGPMFYEIWNTRETPARIDRASGEPHEDGIVLAPPKNGTRIRVLDIPPEGDRLEGLSEEERRAHFAEIGAADAVAQSSRHAFMHRTETIDYGIVLEGELVLIMDVGETVVRAGDIVIQRGTNHGWANRSDRNCRIAFILIDGAFDADLVRS